MAGLALTFAFVSRFHVHVTIFDPHAIGHGGASAVSTGLLHPFPGRRALSSWHSEPAMKAAEQFLMHAENALGQPVSDTSGLVRIVTGNAQHRDFQKRARIDPRVVWWDIEKMQQHLPHALPLPGLFIPEARAVYSTRYLMGLWKACEAHGACWVQAKIHALAELKEYDAVILALGADLLDFPLACTLPLQRIKGHALLCRIPEPLPHNLSAEGHISKTEDPFLVRIGSTYEHHFTSAAVDPKKGLELKEKIARFYPPARDFIDVDLQAAIRIAPHEGYRPLMTAIDARTWVLTGLGSRGLLYHAYLAAQITQQIMQPSHV